MTIPPEFINFIAKYGYFSFFSLVFLQELGMIFPVPNEVVLLFGGYLASIGTLSLPLIILAVISGDFIGTTILYAVFYFFGAQILRRAPRWLPSEKIKILEQKIAKRGLFGVFLGRLIPYLRGYVSVAAGLLRIPPKKFLVSVILSAVLWSGGYVIAGRLLGKQWDKLVSRFSWWQILATVAFLGFLFYIIPVLRRYIKNRSIAK